MLWRILKHCLFSVNDGIFRSQNDEVGERLADKSSNWLKHFPGRSVAMPLSGQWNSVEAGKLWWCHMIWRCFPNHCPFARGTHQPPVDYMCRYKLLVLQTCNMESPVIGDATVALVWHHHYADVIMGAIASQITSLTIVCLNVYLNADQRKQHSSASLAFVRGIHRWPVNSPRKGQ